MLYDLLSGFVLLFVWYISPCFNSLGMQGSQVSYRIRRSMTRFDNSDLIIITISTTCPYLLLDFQQRAWQQLYRRCDTSADCWPLINRLGRSYRGFILAWPVDCEEGLLINALSLRLLHKNKRFPLFDHDSREIQK